MNNGLRNEIGKKFLQENQFLSTNPKIIQCKYVYSYKHECGTKQTRIMIGYK